MERVDGIDRFFEYARERYSIMLRRRDNPSGPWTEDTVLQQYRFCNIFREDDTVTQWFRDNARESLRSSPDVLLATVLFRWFNRVRTGEAIFSQSLLDLGTSPSWGADGITAWNARSGYGGNDEWMDLLRSSIKNYCGRGPYVTGSYIIKTPDGFDKLSGVLRCVEWFIDQSHWFSADLPGDSSEERKLGWNDLGHLLLATRGLARLEEVWMWLRQFPFLGDFMAYEIVTDLSHTDLLCDAPDTLTWANPGPGATRGLGRIHFGNKDKFRPSHKVKLNIMMRDILASVPDHWPSDWPAWDMRTVEHTLCEFDKYERAVTGEGRPRQKLRTG